MLFLILLIIGLFGGIVAGLLGVGGGIIFTPVLFFLFDGKVDNPVIWTIATSLLCTFFAAIGSTRKHFKMHNIFLKESIMTGMFGLIGTTSGKLVTMSTWYSRLHFVILFSTIMMYTSYNFFKGKKEIPGELFTPEKDIALNWHHALIVGGAGGLLATLAGVGGGMIMIPIMIFLYGIHIRKAISISSFAIVLISLFAWVQFALESTTSTGLTSLTLGYVDFGTALPLIIGAFAGSGLGVWINDKVKKRKLEIVFAILSLVVAVRMLMGLF